MSLIPCFSLNDTDVMLERDSVSMSVLTCMSQIAVRVTGVPVEEL